MPERGGAGGVVQASAALSVHCPLATLDDIHVTQRVLWENQPAWAPYLPGLLPGHPLTLRTTFRNDAPVPVLLGVGRPRLLTTTAAGADAASDQRITLLALAPGASRSVAPRPSMTRPSTFLTEKIGWAR
jgi:hypothetical protein